MAKRTKLIALGFFLGLVWPSCLAGFSSTAYSQSPSLQYTLNPVSELRMPGAHEFNTEWGVDGNSPVERDSLGRLVIFNSLQFPWRSLGPSLWQMEPSERVTILNRDAIPGGLWLEATFRDRNGVLFGWFHNEIEVGCENSFLKAPQIRQMVSYDEGVSWEDLGVILSAPEESFDCSTSNFFFAGGNGDFSALYDPTTDDIYFYFSTYYNEVTEQGVSCARLAYQDRFAPVGNVWKWEGAGWTEPGVGGHVKPIFPANRDWHQDSADAYWGPALHYNTFLRKYVMLLNHAVSTRWEAEGFYISSTNDLSNPQSWVSLERLPLDNVASYQAYPQVIGLDPGDTDKTVGRIGRLFISGVSFWEIQFGPPFTKPAREAGPGKQPYPRRSPAHP